MVGPREKYSKLRFSDGLKNVIFRMDLTNLIHSRNLEVMSEMNFKH